MAYSIGRLVDDGQQIAKEANSQFFYDVAKRCAEEVLGYFWSQRWRFGINEGAFATIAPYTAGTIALTKNSKNAVGVGTAWDTAWPTPAVLRPSAGNGETYLVNSFDSVIGLTLDVAFPHASAPAATYSLEFPVYPIGDYLSVGAVNLPRWPGWNTLTPTTYASMLAGRMWETAGVYPKEVYLVPGDGVRDSKLWLWPAPNEVMTVRYQYDNAASPFYCFYPYGELTASVNNGSPTVTVAGGDMLKLGYSLVGMQFEASLQPTVSGTVQAATDTQLTLTSNWTGKNVVAEPFFVSPAILAPDECKPLLRALLAWKYLELTGQLDLAQLAERRARHLMAQMKGRMSRQKNEKGVSGALEPFNLGGIESPPPPIILQVQELP